jgi:hypothetical protein
MGMKGLALILCLAGAAAAADSSGPDEKTKIKLVEYMLKTAPADADPSIVSGFMKIDTETLPKKLREKARAKQMQIDGLVKIHEGKKKGPFRYPAACEIKRYEGPEGIRIMGMIIGNVEIQPEEEDYIEKKTNCSEDQLICEFSMNIVVMKRPGKPNLKRYFMLDGDPLMSIVAEKRAGGASAGNQYFQELKPSCQQSFK